MPGENGAMTCIKSTRDRMLLYFNRENRLCPFDETGEVIKNLMEEQVPGRLVITVV